VESLQDPRSSSARDGQTTQRGSGKTPENSPKRAQSYSYTIQKQIAEEAKALRQIAKERSNEERKARAAELAAARALKKQQRDAATSQKSRNTPKKANERPHKTLHENLLRSIVLWVLEVVLVLHLCRRSLYPKPPRAGAKSKYRKNSNNTKNAQGSI
jgi:hypothetical protein